MWSFGSILACAEAPVWSISSWLWSHKIGLSGCCEIGAIVHWFSEIDLSVPLLEELVYLAFAFAFVHDTSSAPICEFLPRVDWFYISRFLLLWGSCWLHRLLWFVGKRSRKPTIWHNNIRWRICIMLIRFPYYFILWWVLFRGSSISHLCRHNLVIFQWWMSVAHIIVHLNLVLSYHITHCKPILNNDYIVTPHWRLARRASGLNISIAWLLHMVHWTRFLTARLLVQVWLLKMHCISRSRYWWGILAHRKGFSLLTELATHETLT